MSGFLPESSTLTFSCYSDMMVAEKGIDMTNEPQADGYYSDDSGNNDELDLSFLDDKE